MKPVPHDSQKSGEQFAAQTKLADAYVSNVFMQVPLPVVIYKGPSFIIDMINEKALEMWGISYKKAINKPLFEVLPELREQGLEKIFTKVYTTGEPHVVRELPGKYTRNGKTHEVFFNFTLTPVHDLNGTITGITSVNNDVTREVIARKAIAASEKRYNMLMMQSPFAFAIFKGKDMVISIANDSMKQVLAKGNDIEGMPLLEVLPELVGQPFPGYLDNVYTKGIPFYANEALAKLQRNGRLEDVYFNFVYQPYREADNSISGITCIAYEVTNEVLAKKLIEESEKSLSKLGAIIQFSGDAIISKTLEGIVTSWNPGATKIFGYTDKEMIGQHITKIIPEDRLSEEPEIIKRIQKGEAVEHFETKRLSKNGKLLDISVTISPVRDSEGKIIGASKIARDIGQAKKAGEINSRLAAIIEFSEDAIISKTLEGIITSWNPGAQKLFGYTAEEMIGQPVTKVIPKDRLSEEPEILRRIQKGEIVDHFETKRLNKEGNLLDISLTISPVKDSEGKIIGASKIARDISKAKKAELLLKESERQFRQIADSMPQIVWTARPDGHIDYYNKKWYEFTGFTESFDDQNWIHILHPDDVQTSIEKYKHSIKTGEPYHIEFRFKDHEKPGTFHWFMGRANPVRDEQGNIVKWFGTHTEIDDAKRIQEELELGKQQRDDFIKMASHELKTPITTIKGYLQLVLNAVMNDEKEISPLLVRSSMLTMDKQVSRLARLMGELLDLSRIEAGQLELNKELFSLNELVIEMVQDVLYTNDKFSIEIYHDFECRVHADRDRIGQVLTNLLINAIKYSPNAGKIEVRIYKPEKNWVAVSVKDHGIGIAKKEQEKIFERYYRSEGKSEHTYPGFGVGLYIVGEILQRHNGRIFVESEIGKGSTFTFTIPVETENKNNSPDSTH